jgi:hypothetical protein
MGAVVLLVLGNSACAPARTEFGRLLGSADHMEIPIYRGKPPTIYTHVRLGSVTGKGGAWSSLSEQKYRALYNLTKEARAKGANAVIETTGRSTSEGYSYTGEAVAFDVIPPDPEQESGGPMPKDPRRGDQ